MTTQTSNCKFDKKTIVNYHFRHIQIICTVILIVIIIFSCSKIYKNYKFSQDALACDNGRFVIWDRYISRCNESIDSGMHLDEIDKFAYMQDVVKSLYDRDATFNDDGSLSCSGICPDGGTYTIRIGSDTNIVTIDCSADGHEESVSW